MPAAKSRCSTRPTRQPAQRGVERDAAARDAAADDEHVDAAAQPLPRRGAVGRVEQAWGGHAARPNPAAGTASRKPGSVMPAAAKASSTALRTARHRAGLDERDGGAAEPAAGHPGAERARRERGARRPGRARGTRPRSRRAGRRARRSAAGRWRARRPRRSSATTSSTRPFSVTTCRDASPQGVVVERGERGVEVVDVAQRRHARAARPPARRRAPRGVLAVDEPVRRPGVDHEQGQPLGREVERDVRDRRGCGSRAASRCPAARVRSRRTGP